MIRKRKSNRQVRHAKQTRREHVYQALEARNLLASFVVTTTIDDASGNVDGVISLREAMISAETNAAFGDAPAGDADGDSISFSAGLLSRTINLQNGEFAISDDLAIDGGVLGITINAQGNSRVFNINSAQDVSLANLELENGFSAGNGGAIMNAGSGHLLLNQVDLSGNVAANGGGIYSSGSNLTISSSTLSGNIANGASGAGGALVFTQGSLKVTGSTFAGNSAAHAGGALEIAGGIVDLYQVSVSGNQAGAGVSATVGDGGGIRISGSSGTRLVIRDGEVSSNIASHSGGGIWNQSGSTLVIRDSASISGNTALGAAIGDGGGGVFNAAGAVRIIGSSVNDNMATGTSGSGGGVFSADGLLNVRQSTVQGNVAYRSGGGFEIVSGFVLIDETEVGGMSAGQANVAGPSGFAAPGSGGGLHVAGSARTVISDSQFTQNIAAKSGGALWNQTGATMVVRNSSLVANEAQGNASGDGGGAAFNNGGTLRLMATTVSGNAANGANGSGGAIFSTDGILNVRESSSIVSNFAAVAGGGIEVQNGYVRVQASALGSVAAGNAAGVAGTSGWGGGLHVSGSDASNLVVFVNSSVEGNSAGVSGGGLWNQANARMIIRSGSQIRENSAAADAAFEGGGGIFNNGGTVRIIGSTVADNDASGTDAAGGGVLSTGGTLNLRGGSIVAGNSAMRYGGGIAVLAGFTLVSNSEIGGATSSAANSAALGGGIYVNGANGTTFVLDGTLVSANSAALSGGGLWAGGDAFVVVRNSSTFEGNQAWGDQATHGGGGLFLEGSSRAVVRQSSVVSNSANGSTANGGGIHITADATAELDAGLVASNSATALGGGIFNEGSLIADIDSLITLNTAASGGGVFRVGGSFTSIPLSIAVSNFPDNLV